LHALIEQRQVNGVNGGHKALAEQCDGVNPPLLDLHGELGALLDLLGLAHEDYLDGSRLSLERQGLARPERLRLASRHAELQ